MTPAPRLPRKVAEWVPQRPIWAGAASRFQPTASANSSSLYNAYTGYFDDLRSMQKNNDYYRKVQAGNTTAYFYPRARPDGTPSIEVDDIYTILDRVTCTGNTSVGQDGKTVIRIAMDNTTRTDVAEKLWELDDQGCRVQLVYRTLGDAAEAELSKPGGGNGNPEIKRSESRYTDPEGNAHTVHVNSKYMAVEGNYDGIPDRKFVVTGSHNYDDASLHENDDTLLEIHNNVIHDQYRTNFEAIWNSTAG